MYEPPIRLLVQQLETSIREQQEKQIFEAVQKFGVDVDRDELFKALAYDRFQYSKGYEDGRADASRWISVEEKAPVIPCVVYDGHNPPYTPSCIVARVDCDGKSNGCQICRLNLCWKVNCRKYIDSRSPTGCLYRRCRRRISRESVAFYHAVCSACVVNRSIC